MNSTENKRRIHSSHRDIRLIWELNIMATCPLISVILFVIRDYLHRIFRSLSRLTLKRMWYILLILLLVCFILYQPFLAGTQLFIALKAPFYRSLCFYGIQILGGGRCGGRGGGHIRNSKDHCCSVIMSSWIEFQTCALNLFMADK